jgi:pyruvate formate lyase activating enzyme
MIIGGLQKFSMIDYPDKLTAIVFTSGCNFRCGYCHNPELVLPEKFNPSLDQNEILEFFKTRIGKLDAISITGGEPTLHADLPQFMKQIKDLGFLVKLDTNGTNIEMLKEIIDSKLVDYIAMDIKAPLEKYEEVIVAKINLEDIKKSIKMIMDSGIEYEFRTTIVKSQLSVEDLINIGKLIKGANIYYLQKFVASKANDEKFLKEKTYSDEEFEEIKKDILKYVQKCEIR